MQLVYKVVCRPCFGDRKLRSVMHPFDDSAVVYEPGKWTRAPFGMLFAFSFRDQAERFLWGVADGEAEYELWEAETPFAAQVGLIVSPAEDYTSLFKEFWERYFADMDVFDLPIVSAPEGTVGAYKLRLTRKLLSSVEEPED